MQSIEYNNNNALFDVYIMYRSGDKMIDFPEDYFKTEVRDGFTVSSMMKKAWAGQLEVLETIRNICERHNILWFADYGTLLGAVRHKGFIPWDDDMDIGMTRDNLNKFIMYAKDELPHGYKLLCMDLEPEYDSIIVRVVNSTAVSMDEERLKKFHGCPYVLGIDIFPMDYLSRNDEERELHIQLIGIIMGAVDTMSAPDADPYEVEQFLRNVEMLTGAKVDRTKPVKIALLSLAEKLFSIYGYEDADEVTGLWRIVYQKEFHFPKEWFSDLIELPFETITVPVPREYDKVLKLKVGENYMTPIRQETHNYPFYKEQEKMLEARLGYKPE